MLMIILFKSLIIGGLAGIGIGAGAARMFMHRPCRVWERSVLWEN